MATLPVRAGLTAGALLLMGFLGLCADRAGAEPPPEIVVIVVPYGWAEVEQIITCESHWDPTVVNGDQVGLFQLSRIHEWRFLARGWTWAEATDPVKNAAIAGDLWWEQGNGPWRFSRACWGAP